MVFVNDGERAGMWPVRWCNKDWIMLISAPAQFKLLKSICARICTVCHLNHDRYGSCDSDHPVKLMMGALWHAWRLPTLFYSPAAQLFPVPVISQPFFFFFFVELCSGWGENTDVVYWLITAHGLEWSLLQDTSKYSWLHLHSASSPLADEELFPLCLNEFLY